MPKVVVTGLVSVKQMRERELQAAKRSADRWAVLAACNGFGMVLWSVAFWVHRFTGSLGLFARERVVTVFAVYFGICVLMAFYKSTRAELLDLFQRVESLEDINKYCTDQG